MAIRFYYFFFCCCYCCYFCCTGMNRISHLAERQCFPYLNICAGFDSLRSGGGGEEKHELEKSLKLESSLFLFSMTTKRNVLSSRVKITYFYMSYQNVELPSVVSVRSFIIVTIYPLFRSENLEQSFKTRLLRYLFRALFKCCSSTHC